MRNCVKYICNLVGQRNKFNIFDIIIWTSDIKKYSTFEVILVIRLRNKTPSKNDADKITF